MICKSTEISSGLKDTSSFFSRAELRVVGEVVVSRREKSGSCDPFSFLATDSGMFSGGTQESTWKYPPEDSRDFD